MKLVSKQQTSKMAPMYYNSILLQHFILTLEVFFPVLCQPQADTNSRLVSTCEVAHCAEATGTPVPLTVEKNHKKKICWSFWKVNYSEIYVATYWFLKQFILGFSMRILNLASILYNNVHSLSARAGSDSSPKTAIT